jgi:hypothetical protein
VLAASRRTVAWPVVSYALVIALQVRVLWDVWRFKDLIPGDTAGYFLDALSWAHGVHDDIVWSPLYTDFLGTFVAVVRPTYAALMAQRVTIVLIASVLVLALMRALVGPAIGLLIAAWWVLLPPNFNVEYEVHLFGLIPVLVAALVVARRPGRGALGIALAVLLGATILLRNELLIATVIVAGAVLVRERRARRAGHAPSSALIRAYGIPLAVVALLVGGMYWRSYDQGHTAQVTFTAKQDLNMCQVYATNYQQRHPGRFVGNPFSECSTLMAHDFGQRMPSLLQATVANPRAVAAMVGWNGVLLPSGLQVSLFGATVTGTNPDYFPVKEHEAYALVLSILLLVLLVAGAVAVRRDRERWRHEWLPPRVWAVLVLGAVSLMTVVVALTQRPRPEYMYGLTIALMALTGVSISALLGRAGRARATLPAAIAVTLVLVVAVPSYYQAGPRPIHDAVGRLTPVAAVLQRPTTVLLTAQDGFSICSYIGYTFSRHCNAADLPALLAGLARGTPISTALSDAKINVIYAEPVLLGVPAIEKLVLAPAHFGWHQIAGGVDRGIPWHVLMRGR